ncbi:hypothetical protein Mic7113_4303 [Allocoleopsis franciscana PCC 7113]|uniref:Uncharacterized protein n=1 Tax=Allocoleopsis franciscana PCC 7113 TaxID=1173027 RepID=K9WJK4_9CYAN|nr:hypothetical protein Mic7113_4303 [Allocoleopsis franciscana PCC 7113]
MLVLSEVLVRSCKTSGRPITLNFLKLSINVVVQNIGLKQDLLLLVNSNSQNNLDQAGRNNYPVEKG